jgi:hypothetical protein
MSTGKWEKCVSHFDSEVKTFISEYFKPDRKVLFVAGAGFDPRSIAVASLLAASGAQIKAFLIQEERPNPHTELLNRANTNTTALAKLISDYLVLPVSIFDTDNAVIGGRNAVKALDSQSFASVTDVVVDLSALSVGISFPIIRYLMERASQAGMTVNVHVFVSHNPLLDEAIRPIAGDTPGFVHGFRGEWALASKAAAAKLWLPQLARGRISTLQRLFEFLVPHDTCPILPFPSVNPRLGDELSEHFITEMNAWNVDPRDIIFASEDDPLDLYRTILRMDNLRQKVFLETGGSLLVLSPIGSKVMALGGLLAALEKDLPVAYLEPIGYELDTSVSVSTLEPKMVHIWLEGEIYSQVTAI